jgi:hypothetical protein
MPPLLTLPAVDGVEITTIMDNALDLLMSSTPLARRFPLPGYGFIRPQLRAEHDVSLLVTVIDQGKRETILSCSIRMPSSNAGSSTMITVS